MLTGETGTGKTMVVTGLHLLGGARADASRVRSGSERAVVEGRFTTTELGDVVVGRVDEILDSSGADRDDDGSVIAARSVSKDGPVARLSRWAQRAGQVVERVSPPNCLRCTGRTTSCG